MDLFLYWGCVERISKNSDEEMGGCGIDPKIGKSHWVMFPTTVYCGNPIKGDSIFRSCTDKVSCGFLVLSEGFKGTKYSDTNVIAPFMSNVLIQYDYGN